MSLVLSKNGISNNSVTANHLEELSLQIQSTIIGVSVGN